jgi:hypothetical protein
MNQKTKKIIFVLAAVILFFILLEIFVRIGIRIYLRAEYGPDLTRFREMDLEADTKKGWKWEGNQLFRGRFDVPKEKPAGLYRIITTGDSCCWGAMIPQEATFSAKLETLLKSRYGDDRVEVLNAGVVGYNSNQVLEHFRTSLVEYKPDLLIYYGTGEDSALWLRGKMELPLNNTWSPAHRLLFRSRTFRLIANSIDRLKPKKPATTWLEQSDNLKRMQKEIESTGAKLMLVEYLGVPRDKIISHIAGIGLDFQAPVVRTYEAFMLTGRPVRELIFDQVHPTAAGHSIIARQIRDEIVRLKLINE